MPRSVSVPSGRPSHLERLRKKLQVVVESERSPTRREGGAFLLEFLPVAKNDKSPCGNKGLCEWVRYRARVCHGIERRGQDSNLRTSCPVTDLANPRFRPLSHLSCERPLIVQHQRLACKRASATSEHDSCQPAVLTSYLSVRLSRQTRKTAFGLTARG